MKKELLLVTTLLLASCELPFGLGNINLPWEDKSESISNSVDPSSVSESSESVGNIAPFNVDIFCDDLENVDFHTKAQKDFIADKIENTFDYATGMAELSKPAGVTISWFMDDYDVPPEYISSFSGFKVHLYDNAELKNPTVYSIADDTSLTITNLLLNHSYHYQVMAYFGEYEFKSNIAKLTTADTTIRNLDIDGVTNCRDLGGYKTNDGMVVKQGMLFRTGRMSEDYSTTPIITEKGLEVIRNVLHIKSEIDLRSVWKSTDKPENNENGSLSYSVLGSDVNYYQINYCYYNNKDIDDLYDSVNKTGVKKFFKTLANIDNYPISFHCAIGTDRTGYLAFLTLSLLGVSESDCYHDYMFSNFGNIQRTREFKQIKDYLIYRLNNQIEGSTMQEKIVNYLKSVGVTQNDIDSIRSIMLEKQS